MTEASLSPHIPESLGSESEVPVSATPTDTNSEDFLKNLSRSLWSSSNYDVQHTSDVSLNVNEEKDIFLEEGAEELSSDEKIRQNFVSSYIRRFIASSITIVICVIGICFLYIFQRWYKEASVPESASNSYVQTYKSYSQKLLGLLWKGTVSYPQGVLMESDAMVVRSIINDLSLNYIEKRDILQEKVDVLIRTISAKAAEVEERKKDIAKFWFFPSEMRGIVKEESSIDTIQRALSALEIVKFTTAVHVFPHMDSILTVMANMLGVNKADLKAFLEKVQSRGEKDIASYVRMCYLNPYEVDKNCLAIGDLDRYYKDILKDTSIDLSLLKNVLSYLDTFLEQKDITSFSILFNGFNAATKSIDFSVDINITKQDQLKLMEDKILNPQIFILTQIINLLKQSFFVIGANIDAKTIAVTTKTVTVGNTTYTVLNSRKNFSLPIQKETEREIFNYIDDNALLELEGLSNIHRPMEFTDAEEVSEVIVAEASGEEQERVKALEAEVAESSEEASSEEASDVAEPNEAFEAFEE